MEGIDYKETFSLVARYTYIRMIISLAASMGWRLHHMDVNTTLLNRESEEESYIEKPNSFMIHEKEFHVCRLKKALYGLNMHLNLGM